MSDLDVIKEIEKIIGKELKPCPRDADIMDYDQRGSYLSNGWGQIIGLNLKDFKLEKIDFLINLSHLTYLDLSVNQISDITALQGLTNLTILGLPENKISDISALQALTNLTQLGLYKNQIRDISALQGLTNLLALSINENQISDISVLKSLSNLKQLWLYENQIRDISPLQSLINLTELSLQKNQISDISPLQSLTHLTQLWLHQNQISDISALQRLINLTILTLWENQISDISVLQGLTNLTSLSLSNNQISDITPLQNLINLTSLILHHNLISDITVLKALEKLKQVSIDNNNLTVLPEWVLNLGLAITWREPLKINVRQGKTFALPKFNSEGCFYVQDNPFTKPPPEIIKNGNDSIRRYFEQIEREGKDYIYEAKLILVGEKRAGKTSLANKIINPDYQLVAESESQRTSGIDVFPYSFDFNIDVYPYGFKPLHVNIWDFGGDEIYHQTHQFFLTERSLYLIVVDNRDENPNLDYWFKLVELLSGKCPLLIIENEKYDKPCCIEVGKLKAEFDNIKDNLKTNLKDNRGLDKITTAVKYYIENLPHIGKGLPKNWVKVREALTKDKRNYIDFSEYEKICEANNFLISKMVQPAQKSSFWHECQSPKARNGNVLVNRILTVVPIKRS